MTDPTTPPPAEQPVSPAPDTEQAATGTLTTEQPVEREAVNATDDSTEPPEGTVPDGVGTCVAHSLDEAIPECDRYQFYDWTSETLMSRLCAGHWATRPDLRRGAQVDTEPEQEVPSNG